MKKTTQNTKAEVYQRIEKLNAHAWKVINCDVNEALEFATCAINLSKKHKYQKGIADYTRTLSFVQLLKANGFSGCFTSLSKKNINPLHRKL